MMSSCKYSIYHSVTLTLTLTVVIITLTMSFKSFMEKHGYTFKKDLGEGRYGKVVSAYSTHLKSYVAVKVIDKKKLSSSSDYLENHLPREMEIIMSLNHPNIVKTHEIFELSSKKVFIVMEICRRGDLMKYISVRGALAEELSCMFFTQLCEAVQYLHNNDVVHRDLKCENLLLDSSRNLKVCDFGFSKRLTYKDGRIVLSKTYCGTASYAAPEILRGFPYNPKVSDVWSMGVVLYMMLYASMPYDSSNIRRMVDVQIKHNINFPDTPSVSSEAKDLIRSILHPVIKERITISQILQSSWILREGKMEDSESDPAEGPSTAAPRD